MESEASKNEKDYIEKDYIKIYQDKGYVSNFYFKDDKLINSETKKEYSPEDILIVAEHRYEGISNPSDMSILYVLETSKDEKGTYLAAYGANANIEDAEFFKKVPKSNVSNEEDININK
ncbi:MAG: hypothetical protein ACM31G_02220 [Flavobacteriales bacterium]